VRIGAQYAVTDSVRLGVAFLSPIYMSRFKDYAGLFAEQGDFNIPPALTVGAMVNLDETKILFVDYQHIWYDHVNSVGNPFASPGALGQDDGPGFGWRDVGTLRLGFLWQASDTWHFRAGYSYNSQPIPKSEVLFNVLAPGVVQHHFTAGLSRRVAGHTWVHLAALVAPTSSVTAPNPFDASQTIRIQMHQYEATIGISRDF
jgi:long-chain fatty acid transport protein